MKSDIELAAGRSHRGGKGQRLHVSAGPGQRIGARKNLPQPAPVSRDLPAGELVVEAAALPHPGAAALVPELEWTVVDLVATWGYRHW